MRPVKDNADNAYTIKVGFYCNKDKLGVHVCVWFDIQVVTG